MMSKIAQYSDSLATIISSQVCEGRTIQSIANELDIPAHVIYRWQREHVEFEEMVKAARSDRAHYYHDKIVEIAESEMNFQDARVNKLRADIYKWAAKVGNRNEFGDQTKIKGDNDSPLQIIVDTGIRRNTE
jgi:hypothetical protein